MNAIRIAPGAALVIAYTALIASADAAAKALAADYAAAQLFGVAGALVAAFAALSARRIDGRSFGASLRTAQTGLMAARAGLTVLASACFFQAFRLLPFADVFLFIGLMPLVAAMLAGPILSERVSPRVWLALGMGICGVFVLMPPGGLGTSPGHGFALAATVSGTLSMVLSRKMSTRENKPLAQVFWTNLALAAAMLAVLPAVYQPMPLAHWGLVVGYAVLLFGARWLLVAALRLVPAHSVMLLMNAQFLWMVLLGALVFGEWPGMATWLGAAIVIAAGVACLAEPKRAGSPSAAKPA